jgi:hypothetical protein
MSRIVIVILLYHRHKPVDHILLHPFVMNASRIIPCAQTTLYRNLLSFRDSFLRHLKAGIVYA